MNYIELKALFINKLIDQYGDQEAFALFLIAIQKLSGLNKLQYYQQQQTILTTDLMGDYTAVLQDLQQGIPIQYIFQETQFYGLKFKVNPAVLIPRDETEELVDLIIRDIKSSGNAAKSLLDIGTGSGCIAIAIQSKVSNLKVSAMDISAEALAVAQENAAFHQLPINFIQADVLKLSSLDRYDIIVSNPPYIKEYEKTDMRSNVLENEPHTALFVSNEDPLIFYRIITKLALKSLHPGGRLYFEINEQLGIEMKELVKELGFEHIQLIQDMQQKDRIIKCSLIS